jgi:glycosyltransferase involved in cell wall biosynthesis
MKIVYVITRMDELGGPQIHIRDFAGRMQDLGHAVTVVSGTDGPLLQGLRDRNIDCHVIPEMTRAIGFLREFWAIVKLKQMLRIIRPDVVSCHSSKAGVIGRMAGKWAGCRTIFTVHGWAFTENIPFVPRLIYRIVETVMGHFFTDKIITVSDYDRTLGLNAWVAPAAKIITVHNGMKETRHAPIPALDQTVRMIMVARFAPQKDQALLVDALSECIDLPWHLRLVGNGPSQTVQDQINRLGVQDRITILGQRSDVDALLAESDVFCLITHWEGFPRSIIEAMRAGLPVIATSVAGVPEAVKHDVTGLLVPHGDRAALVQVLRDMIQDPARRRGFGQAGRQKYDQYFTFETMFQNTVRIYEQVTGMVFHMTPVDNAVEKRNVA